MYKFSRSYETLSNFPEFETACLALLGRECTVAPNRRKQKKKSYKNKKEWEEEKEKKKEGGIE